jgi:antitoxin component of RelBE/YafQ-DinJ toxin-antitoxin module
MATVLVNFRIDGELKAAAQEAAQRERRTFTGMIELMLIDRCKALGTLPKDWQRDAVQEQK